MYIKQESGDLGLSSTSVVDMFPWVDLQVSLFFFSGVYSNAKTRDWTNSNKIWVSYQNNLRFYIFCLHFKSTKIFHIFILSSDLV